MTNEIIRIYTAEGFVFDLSYDWLINYLSLKENGTPKEIFKQKHRLDELEKLRNLSWAEIVDELKFVGIIEDPNNDTLKTAVIDFVNKPLNYRITKLKKMQLKISLL